MTVGEFRWNEEHERHLWQGRVLTVPEFNAWARSPEWDRTVERYGALLRLEVVAVMTEDEPPATDKDSLSAKDAPKEAGTERRRKR